jgi:hypothetical protein
MKRVAVLTHPKLPLDGRYYLGRIAELWRREGRDVRVAEGPGTLGEADALIPHVCLTAMPPDYLEALRRHPAALNARVGDISKRRVSRLVLAPGAAFDGPVIVKSNLNAHGMGEARAGAGAAYRYEVYESTAELPPGVWERPDFVVERFEPELEDSLFWLRTWNFLGDREIGFRYSSENPVAQGDGLLFRDVLSSVPEELRRLRAELGFDYGSFDYGIAEGNVFVYDVNWTPGFPRSLPPERAEELVQTLAAGLDAFA